MEPFFEGHLNQVGAKIRRAGKSGLTGFETNDRWPTGRFAAERNNEDGICSQALIAPVE